MVKVNGLGAVLQMNLTSIVSPGQGGAADRRTGMTI
jgi:hypothetical protein